MNLTRDTSEKERVGFKGLISRMQADNMQVLSQLNEAKRELKVGSMQTCLGTRHKARNASACPVHLHVHERGMRQANEAKGELRAIVLGLRQSCVGTKLCWEELGWARTELGWAETVGRESWVGLGEDRVGLGLSWVGRRQSCVGGMRGA